MKERNDRAAIVTAAFIVITLLYAQGAMSSRSPLQAALTDVALLGAYYVVRHAATRLAVMLDVRAYRKDKGERTSPSDVESFRRYVYAKEWEFMAAWPVVAVAFAIMPPALLGGLIGRSIRRRRSKV